MWWWIGGIYFFGFVVTVMFHALFLQMVTMGLAIFRGLVWPVFWLTGWPSGQPLMMD